MYTVSFFINIIFNFIGDKHIFSFLNLSLTFLSSGSELWIHLLSSGDIFCEGK